MSRTLPECSLNITRDSTDGTVPIVSTLMVTNVTAALNGTTVECTTDNRQTQVIMKSINIIRSGPEGDRCIY